MNGKKNRLITSSKNHHLSNLTLALIPCYNEEATIGSIVLKARHYVDEVLVIDDGSTDDTARIAQEAGATVISHGRNMGKSKAIKTGFKYVLNKGFDYVVTIDGDWQHNPAEIKSVLGNVMNNGHDISIGCRSGITTEMPTWRRVGKRVLDYSTGAGNGGFVTDSQCGFRAFNKNAVELLITRLNGGSFSTESEQLIKAHELGLKVVNTHVSCRYKNLNNTSTKNPASHAFSVLKYVVWMIAEKRPLLFMSLPGFVFVVFGLFLSIITLQSYNQTHIFPIVYAIFVSIFLIIGAIGMFMGLMLNVLPNIIRRVKIEES